MVKEGGFYIEYDACPACKGSGRQSDVMPVADSVADADTLVRITQSAHGVESVATYYDGPAVFAAAKYGADLAWLLRAGGYPSRKAILRPLRAAFRAIPGLRA